LVHPSAQQDLLTSARHRAFIAPRLLGSFVALAALPVYLAMRGVPTALEVLMFAWFMAPILVAYFLSRTGYYESAYVLSSLALTGLVTVVAFNTGGISSFAAIWLVVVPLEAALSASRRVVATSSTIALGAACLLLIFGALDLMPSPVTTEQGQRALVALGVISAALYATGLALSAESLARMSLWLFHAEENRYRLLARNMTNVIARHNRKGALLFVSPAVESLLGVGVGDLAGHGLFDRVHVADRPAYLTALTDAAALGEPRSVEFRARRELAGSDMRGGVAFIWIEMRCHPLESPDGAAAESDEREVVAVMCDVTQRKLQEQRLVEARTEAERANAAKSHFLATMSHELRTPLNAVIGFSEMLLNEETMRIDAVRRQDYAKLINDSGNHLLSVVNGILDMSKIDTGEFEITAEPFALAPLIANCGNLLALKAREAEVEIATAGADDLPEIIADRRALKQILLNLLSNAIKFTDRGGRVTVSAMKEGQWIAISVEDTGVGIAADDLPRLGNPFFQARSSYDRPHDGTGLGLSIVKGLAALHGGDVAIESSVGVGTIITVRLPIDCQRAARAAAEPAYMPAGIADAGGPVVKDMSVEIDLPVKKRA
jgi:cell cycle sensor histidine kinase DivJ